MFIKFSKLFWFLDAKKLDKNKDRNLIIHQVLAFGSLRDIRKLFKVYPKAVIKDEFLKNRKGIYDPKTLAWLKIILGVKRIDERKYVKKIY